MKQTNPAIGDLVAVTFDDHAEDSDTSIEATVYGVYAADDDKCVRVESWVPNMAECEGRVNNTKRFAILKCAITGMRRLTIEQGRVKK